MTLYPPTNLNIMVLHGKSASGKTKTISKAVKLLLENGFSMLKEYTLENADDNICCVLEKNNKLIGITSRDNDVSQLRKDFELLGYMCDLYICCCKSKGRTMGFIGGLSQDGIQLHIEKITLSYSRIPPSISIDEIQNSLNTCQATEIVKIATSILENI